MEYEVVITKLALADVKETFRYIAVDLNEPMVATRMKEAILNCIDDLSTFPMRNALIDDVRISQQAIRRAIVKNYNVFYRVTGNRVLILRVMYNRRDWQNIL